MYGMRVRRRLVISIVTLVVCALGFAPPALADSTYSSQLLYFSVQVGPDRATQCTVVGELTIPDGVSAGNRAPAILTTNGFGGSYKDQIPMVQFLAENGYVGLTYSGLGFGGTTCKITLDAPAYDGIAASQLVSFLGGSEGIAFTDPGLTQPFPALDVVVRDSVDHNGVPSINDPRVGMSGGSYGGGIQFAAASVDPRIDTIIPMITWNDLSYSLAPNSTGIVTGVSTVEPGASKVLFASLLFGLGVTNPGVDGYVADPARLEGCPNYVSYMCNAIAQAVVTGEVGPKIVADLRASSVASYIDQIKIPVLLAQGQQDTLFDLNEATATYEALKSHGVDVKMIWHSWGHSHLAAAPGEFSFSAPDAETQYETGRFLDWFDHYLRDENTETGPEFAYFRNWIDYEGNAAPAYATSNTVNVGSNRDFHLSADGALLPGGVPPVPGANTIVTAPAGLPTGIEPLNISPAGNIPNVQIPGTEALWTSAPMTDTMDVVGSPTVTLRVAAPGQPVVFAKVYDVAPDGSSTLINGLIAPIRISDPSQPVPVTMPAIVHRFEPDHAVRLAITGGDISFRGGLAGMPVTIFADASGPLQLPVVG
ncbi:CocE/NonD family hydrolase [Rhodococcus globerulus]|nr:CocE/NonD family hydrolase [Rhodococcus globerulus]NMD63375.1 ABC transporter ATP-binding protein [Nocardia globerula]